MPYLLLVPWGSLKAPHTLWWDSWKWTCRSCRSSMSALLASWAGERGIPQLTLVFWHRHLAPTEIWGCESQTGSFLRGVVWFFTFAIVPLCHSFTEGPAVANNSSAMQRYCRRILPDAKAPESYVPKGGGCQSYHKALLLNDIRGTKAFPLLIYTTAWASHRLAGKLAGRTDPRDGVSPSLQGQPA